MSETTQQTTDDIRGKRKNKYKKIIKWLWGLCLAGVLGVIILFISLSLGDLPTFEQLENPKDKFASEVFANNGETIGRYYIENRVPVGYDDLSTNLVNALVATEDERYFEHSGVDAAALMRVITKTVFLRRKNSGGGSTISQQLAKLLYSNRDFRGMGTLERYMELFFIKLKEWITAVKLERSYTKEEIITMYLNHFEFLYQSYGIKAAAENYFGKQQDSLKIEEAATLIGMLKNPALYNPVRRPDTVLHRRMIVLSQMKKNGFITEIAYDSLRILPLGLKFRKKTHTDGLAPYFRMELRKEVSRILKNGKILKPDESSYDIYKDGLKIYTTIDPLYQAHAEAAMLEHMEDLQKKFWKHWKGKDPWTYKEYNTTKRQLSIREKSLQRNIRSSERYKELKGNYLRDIIDKIKKDVVDLSLKDYDIDRLLKESKENGHITKLLARKLVSSEKAAKYRKILKSDLWPTLKKDWTILQDSVEKAFNRPAKMVVFDYKGPHYEKDTIMTPLDSIRYHRMFLQSGVLAVHPATGEVKAWVGGINYKYFAYDHVTSPRQVGSTFKPFIYATAIAQQGISPCEEVDDVPHTIHKGDGNFGLIQNWTPKNFGEFTGESFTLFQGLKKSKNTVSVHLMKQLGEVDLVLKTVANMGIDTSARYSNGQFRVPRQPSICLGATDLSVYEMTGAYTTFANNGIYNRPTIISRIEDKNGRTIYQEFPEEHPAINPNPNYVMVEMLKYVVLGSPGFYEIKSEVGGKTGTTNNHVDGWFMGLTPNLVVGTWVGGEDQWIRFRDPAIGQGSKLARPVFAKFLQRIEQDSLVDYNFSARFTRPSGDLGIETDCEVYKRKNRSRASYNGDSFDEDYYEEADPNANNPEEDSNEIDENDEFDEGIN